MSSLWQNLVIILEQEISLYQRLLKTMGLQKNFIKSGSLEGISETTKEQNTLVLNLKMVSETRWRLTKKISSVCLLNNTESSLVKIIELSPEPYLSKLRNHYINIKEIAKKIKLINTGNYIFFRHSLHHVQNAINLLIDKRIEYNEDGSWNTDNVLESGFVDAKF